MVKDVIIQVYTFDFAREFDRVIEIILGKHKIEIYHFKYLYGLNCNIML